MRRFESKEIAELKRQIAEGETSKPKKTAKKK